MSAGRFSRVACMFCPKNSFPSTSTCVTGRPFRVYFPSSSTSIPGSFFTSSSTIAPSCTLKASALYTRVSSLTVISVICPCTTASRIRVEFSRRSTSPSSRRADLPEMLTRMFSSRKPMQVKRMTNRPTGTSVSTYCPSSPVWVSFSVLPLASIRCTCTPGKVSCNSAPSTLPRNCMERSESARWAATGCLRVRFFCAQASAGSSKVNRITSAESLSIRLCDWLSQGKFKRARLLVFGSMGKRRGTEAAADGCLAVSCLRGGRVALLAQHTA